MLSLPLAPATNSHPVILAKDLKCLVDNVYHEARGESFLGQVLVARTTLNRGKNICASVYAYKQFSWTLKPRKITDPKAYHIAYNAAVKAFTYNVPTYYFHAKHVNPKWAKSKQFLFQEGNHKFYAYL